MKNLRIFAILALLVSMVSVAFVSAQDAEENNAEAEGVIFHTFESGTFVANQDDTFSLVLDVVAENAGLYYTAPSIFARNYLVSELSNDWAFANELGEDALVGTAHLEFDNVSIVLEVSTPIYDEETGTLTYSATFVEGTEDGVAMKDGFSVPVSFDDAILFIELDTAFISTLMGGRDVRASEIRIGLPCMSPGC